MNARSGTLSPESNAGSEWSGFSRYKGHDSAYSSPHSPAVPNSRSQLITPPHSGSSNGMSGMNGVLSSGMHRRPGHSSGNPSPPSSVARSSVGTNASVQNRKAQMMEESLTMHYNVLKRYLAQTMHDDGGKARPNRARDKLLRLTTVQFQELSTDVYDELLRRQAYAAQQRNGASEVPEHLVPKENFHPKRNQARQKLSTLPAVRFRDLATDVFFELERRFPRFAGGNIERVQSPASSLRGPPSRTGTPNGMRPPSRGQGAIRGPGGPGGFPPRHGSLGGQSINGLGIPGIGGPDDVYGRPQAKTFQSNTIVPNKSTMVEDDDDQTGPEDNFDNRSDVSGLTTNTRRNRRETNNDLRDAERERKITEYETQVSDLKNEVNHLQTSINERDLQLESLRSAHEERKTASNADRDSWAQIRLNLEGKLENALNLNHNLQSELERVRSQYAEKEQSLRSQVDDLSRRGKDTEWQMRFEDLERNHQTLQLELHEQRQVTSEVKQEATAFLSEMKALSEQSSSCGAREEMLVHQVHRLEEEVKAWRSRYSRAKTRLRSLRATSTEVSIQQPDVTSYVKGNAFTQPDGLIEDMHVTRFQLSIDDLLRAARVDEPGSVLEHIKSVVISTRQISRNISDGRKEDDSDQQQQIASLIARLSATANNLIIASKNFAASNGVSPVSLLDAAASHLTATIVELIRIVKIRPTPLDELEQDDDENMLSSPKYFDTQQVEMTSTYNDSIYSAISSPQTRHQSKDFLRRPSSRHGLPASGGQPPSAPTLGFGISIQDGEIEDLKIFLEDQTSSLVHSIQALVTAIRSPDSAPPTIRVHVASIASLISHVTEETHTTLSANRGGGGHHESAWFQSRVGPVLRSLGRCRAGLEGAEKEARGLEEKDGGQKEWREWMGGVPPLAFEVAREVKELVAVVEGGGGGEREDEEDVS